MVTSAAVRLVDGAATLAGCRAAAALKAQTRQRSLSMDVARYDLVREGSDFSIRPPPGIPVSYTRVY
jgi:hypothetical protein|tara:strand:+ start:1392 stop:1592 length:201 start_codon:yes stop_codon:yes gene_type:complete